MGQLYAFRLGDCVAVGLVFFSICITIQAQSTPGFISIDCGGSPSFDNITKFSWEGDDNYTLTGLSGTVPVTVDSTLDNYQALKTFRYFPDGRSKHCYDLRTSSNVSFLLRAMFLQGSASELLLPITFDVAVNGTTWFTVSYDDSSDILSTPIIQEGIFYTAGGLTHVCLVTDTGVPFISSLELRQFSTDDLMYNFPNSDELYLSRLWRYNCGAPLNSPTVRYPDDIFDRLWITPGTWSKIPTTNGTADTNSLSTWNSVPPAAMKDAWTESGPGSSFWYTYALGTLSPVDLYIAVYFEELNSTAAMGDRVFTVQINGSSTLEEVTPVDFVQRADWYNAVLTDQVNISFVALENSTLGPILNAMEGYTRNDFNNSATATQDVHELAALQVSFSLTDWQGDPCYPVSWDWVGCTGDVPARVNELLLSSMGINATIPASISNLDALTAIHLDNNSLYGAIPDSLASLPDLTYLSLDDNNLAGDVPAALITKLGSNFLYYGNKLLSNSSTNPPSNSTKPAPKKSSNTGVIVGAAAGGVVVFVILVGLLVCCCCKKSPSWKTADQPNQAKVQMAAAAMGTAAKPSYQVGHDILPSPYDNPSSRGDKVSYETVRKATDNFSRELGKGSFGSVYFGRLNNKDVAVKLHNIKSDQGRQEFITEVEILKRVHHKNLVSLVAYCDDGTDLILIYEYEVNGTLREWLYATPDAQKVRGTLDWNSRLQIASDAAEGLEYLHKMCVPPVIHRDVKSSNILLDQSMTGKVADFGLSKATPFDKTSGYSTKVKGTHGYLDMEYHQLGKVTYKSDVFSYGVVLAEIITGMPPYRIDEEGQPFLLLEFVDRMVKTNDMQNLADPKLEGAFNMESMWKMAELVLACTNRVGAFRPEFTAVVNTIKEAIETERSFTTHSPFLPQSGSFSLRSSHHYQNLQ